MSAGKESGVPRPTGYTEYQTKISGPDTKSVDVIHLAIQSLKDKVARDEPRLIFYSMRTEHVMDATRTPHINIYLGFVPRRAAGEEPIDPRNLNDAPAPKVGEGVSELNLPLGWKEEKFGRGT